VAQMWAPASAPGHHVTAELEERMSAYEWRPDPKRPYRTRFRGPVVLLGLRQDEVTTSADFDRKLLHRLYAEHVLDDHGAPQDDRVGRLLLLGQRIRANERTGRASSRQELRSGSARAGHEGRQERVVLPVRWAV
jgi:hypothetical protein